MRNRRKCWKFEERREGGEITMTDNGRGNFYIKVK